MNRKGDSDIKEILNMGDHTHNVASQVAFTESLFRATPRQIVFETFEPLKRYEQKVTFRNGDSVVRALRVIPPKDRVFMVSEPHYQGNSDNAKIAPGMEVTYIVSFRPEEDIDYYYELEFMSERERFFVPIKGIGPRAKLQIPEVVKFDDAPACHLSERTFLARNVGNKAARLYLTTSTPFEVVPSSVSLEPQGAIQVKVMFNPMTLGDHEGDLVVECDDEPPVVVHLCGHVIDMDVTTDKSVILCDATYVTLAAHQTFSVKNNSDILVRFSLKNNATRQEDEDKQRDEMARIEEQEECDRRALTAEGLDLSDQSDDDEELGMGLTLAAHKKKYARMIKMVYEDKQLFSHDIFAVEPLEGEIYPGGEMEFLVTFTPAIAVEYINSVYCEISGRALRTPIHLKGRGIGPRVCFSYAGLNLDDVFMNTVYEYQAELENRGEIEARFQLNPSGTQYGQFFSFSPETGVLGIGEKRTINISVLSNTAGSFGEDFAWTIQGSPNDLKIRFQGEFIGPDVSFDAEILDFEHVSYGFINSKIFRLCNTSPIPAAWSLSLNEDGKLLDREFDIVPSSGTILPHGKQKVQVDFVSRHLRNYNLQIALGIEGVGDQVKTLPISATCEAPRVSFNPPRLDFKETYIRHPAVMEIELVNNSDLPARIEVVEQDELQLQTASIVPDEARVVIAPYQSHTMEVTVTSFRLGMTSLPMNVLINGYDAMVVVDVQAQVLGPSVVLPQPVLDFKNCKVFETVVKELVWQNPTPIPAPITVQPFKGTVFTLSQMEAVIPPESELTLDVTVLTDDAQPFKEEVKVVVEEGDEVGMTLKCKGVGTTIQCDEELETVDFSDVYTHRTCQKKITLHNRSKKPQDVEWILEKLKDKKGDLKPNTFVVEPAKVKMPPRSSQEFTLQGSKTKPGEIEETVECLATSGKSKLTVYTTKVSATFNNPLLDFTERNLSFHYTGKVNPDAAPAPTDVLRNEVTVTNVSPLALDVMVKCPEGFSADVSRMKLAPSESKDVVVEFIVAGSEEKRESETRKQTLLFTYKDHPQKDKVELNGVIVFPNLLLEYFNVDFGAVLNETEARSYLTITNTSAVPVKSHWVFEQDDKPPGKNHIATSQIFDIVPIRSSLGVGESEQVEFVFFGHKGRGAKAVATCIVEDGPEYKVKLRGEASGIDYKFDKQVIDFGSLQYEYAAERDFTIQNTGKVEFTFNIATDGVKPPRVCVVQPLSGKIAPGSKQRVMVKVTPGMPEAMDSEFLEVQVAHLEPEIVKVMGAGTFPNGWTTLPRADSEAYTEFRALVDDNPEEFNTPVLVEAEADRRVFCSHLEQVAVEFAAQIAKNPPPPATAKSTANTRKATPAPLAPPKDTGFLPLTLCVRLW
jgi:hydrocephalus-inducing protein